MVTCDKAQFKKHTHRFCCWLGSTDIGVLKKWRLFVSLVMCLVSSQFKMASLKKKNALVLPPSQDASKDAFTKDSVIYWSHNHGAHDRNFLLRWNSAAVGWLADVFSPQALPLRNVSTLRDGKSRCDTLNSTSSLL